jgi:hypothetical protein
LTKKTKNKEGPDSCLQAISTHLKITIDIARNYLEDEQTEFANGIVPITSVISSQHALMAISRQRELGLKTETGEPEELFVLRESLQKKSKVWGLAGASIQC